MRRPRHVETQLPRTERRHHRIRHRRTRREIHIRRHRTTRRTRIHRHIPTSRTTRHRHVQRHRRHTRHRHTRNTTHTEHQRGATLTPITHQRTRPRIKQPRRTEGVETVDGRSLDDGGGRGGGDAGLRGDPVDIRGHPGVDARVAGEPAAVPPARDAREEGGGTLADHQRTAAVPRAGVGPTAGGPGAHHEGRPVPDDLGALPVARRGLDRETDRPEGGGVVRTTVCDPEDIGATPSCRGHRGVAGRPRASVDREGQLDRGPVRPAQIEIRGEPEQGDVVEEGPGLVGGMLDDLGDAHPGCGPVVEEGRATGADLDVAGGQRHVEVVADAVTRRHHPARGDDRPTAELGEIPARGRRAEEGHLPGSRGDRDLATTDDLLREILLGDLLFDRGLPRVLGGLRDRPDLPDAADEGETGQTQRSHSADSHAGVSSVSEPRRSAWAPLWSQP